MGKPTAEQIAQRVFDLGLLDDRELLEVWSTLGTRSVSLDDFLQVAVRRELLTNYQVERLLKGDRHGFFFGDYKVLYMVGAGTFARVYRAAHKDTGQIVAVKVLRKRFSDNPLQYEQFLKEGALGHALRHPNIVPIFEVHSEKTTHYLVMEFVEGRNLREFVKVRGKLEPLEATRLMIDVGSGLSYAFEHGLTHRDLKMSNVLISSTGQAKLVDFGLAAIGEGWDDGSGEARSTRAIDYAGLERATGVRKDDTRSDIFFCGCMFYHMLTGEPPLLETRDRLQRLSKSRFLASKPVHHVDSSLPHPIVAVVNKAMSVAPNQRYQTPGEMVAELQHAAKKLIRGLQDADDQGQPGKDHENRKRLADTLRRTIKPTHSLMVVESAAEMQDALRDGFKRAGYRVLLTSDPKHAVTRFRQNNHTADAIIFSCQHIGEEALAAFNDFGEPDQKTAQVPAILLLDEKQGGWKDKARHQHRHRVVLTMPITLKQLRAEMAKLVPPE